MVGALDRGEWRTAAWQRQAAGSDHALARVVPWRRDERLPQAVRLPLTVALALLAWVVLLVPVVVLVRLFG